MQVSIAKTEHVITADTQTNCAFTQQAMEQFELQVLRPALSSVWSHCSPHHTTTYKLWCRWGLASDQTVVS